MDNGNYVRKTGETGAVVFLVCSVVLFLGALGIMIWLLVDFAEDHMVKNILYGSAFLAVSLGVMLYSIFAIKAPRFSSAALWTSMVLGVAAFIVGLALNPEPSESLARTHVVWVQN